MPTLGHAAFTASICKAIYEILSKNNLDDNFIASPAVVDNQIFIRGYKSLYCIAQK